ncbi:MAG: leucyl aminopeptidase [Myxococcota bacterium]|nr:leucyl aminopeptidase [Myxococcota bacterium]
MKLTVKTQNPGDIPTDLLTVPVFSSKSPTQAKKSGRAKTKDMPSLPRAVAALDKALGGPAQAALESHDFTGAAGQKAVIYATSGSSRIGRILLYGLGPAEDLDTEKLRNLAGAAADEARSRKLETLSILAPSHRGLSSEDCAAALAEGAVLGGYRHEHYKSSKTKKTRRPDNFGPLRQVSLVFPGLKKPAAVRRRASAAQIASQGQNLARDLSNAPANELPPAALAREARRVARETGLVCRVIRGPELESGGFHALRAVGQGSQNPPHLIVLEHRGARSARARKAGPLCLVGKGITFDSGGISLKPSGGMQDMKHDMSGAATVVGAMQAIAQLNLPCHVVGIIAAAENMPGGRAYRPGDVIGSRAGKTIEITNTDAEGRLVLADALDYAVDLFKPAAMVDLATLTGACMVALGEWATGVFGNSDELSDEMAEAGQSTGECMWPMPLFPDHLRIMKSHIADIKNSGSREAGASTAAAFLEQFVGETPWVHLDIAGTAWKSPQNSYQKTGATGVGVRTLVRWVEERVQQ